jgi:hypothetical protein
MNILSKSIQIPEVELPSALPITKSLLFTGTTNGTTALILGSIPLILDGVTSISGQLVGIPLGGNTAFCSNFVYAAWAKSLPTQTTGQIGAITTVGSRNTISPAPVLNASVVSNNARIIVTPGAAYVGTILWRMTVGILYAGNAS